MNVITQLTARIEAYRATNKQPCKNYATEAAAEKATAAAAKRAGMYFIGEKGEPARYVVFYIAAWDRWVGALDYTELLGRKEARGGYIGAISGFFTY